MIARLRKKTEAAAIREPSTPRNVSGEAPMIAERLHSRALVQHHRPRPDRSLRNPIAWIVVVILIRLLFF